MEEPLACQICGHETPRGLAGVMSCGHTFCRPCLHWWLQLPFDPAHLRRCPACFVHLASSGTHIVPPLLSPPALHQVHCHTCGTDVLPHHEPAIALRTNIEFGPRTVHCMDCARRYLADYFGVAEDSTDVDNDDDDDDDDDDGNDDDDGGDDDDVDDNYDDNTDADYDYDVDDYDYGDDDDGADDNLQTFDTSPTNSLSHSDTSSSSSR